MSFGFKHGMPIDADLVFDVRFLKTRTMWRSYVQNGSSNGGIFLCVSVGRYTNTNTKLTDLLDFMIPLYRQEGKSQLVIAFGCTGASIAP